MIARETPTMRRANDGSTTGVPPAARVTLRGAKGPESSLEVSSRSPPPMCSMTCARPVIRTTGRGVGTRMHRMLHGRGTTLLLASSGRAGR